MSLLDLLNKHHDEWVAVAHSFGAGAFSEDIVQEVYIKLHLKYGDDYERLMYNDTEINKYFVFTTVRNMVTDKIHRKKNIIEIDAEINDDLTEAPEELDNEAKAFEKLYDQVWEVVDDMYWYDKKMFHIYHTTDMSMRDIEKETGISLMSIFNTLKKAKLYVKNELYESWEDYCNGDYDKV